MLIIDERGRIGIVTSHTDAGVFAAPLGTPYKIKDKERVTGVGNAILLTPTYWHREPDGSYTGKWYDSRLGDFVTAQEIPEQSFAASTMGRKGGKSKSDAKAAAARENAKKGGRPPICAECKERCEPGLKPVWMKYRKRDGLWHAIEVPLCIDHRHVGTVRYKGRYCTSAN
jgi:hypothetical protein